MLGVPGQPDLTDEMPSKAPTALVFGVFLSIFTWLAIAASVVQIEYYDGFSAIANARYFLGATDQYIADRAPIMGLLLTPSELVRTALGLHPLDVRPYHIWLALFHVGYLVLTYRAMTKLFGASWTVFLAWLAAIPNFMFFSYSPFLSHDILPGLLLLYMLFWCDQFIDRPSLVLWGGMVVLGSIAALVKQTFGVFWILLLLSSACRGWISGDKPAREMWARLAGGAVASGCVTWLVLGYLLRHADPSSSIIARPLHNLQYLSSVYEGKDVVFPLWIYLRNGPAYGWLALVLVVPGLVLSLRGKPIQQSIALCWLGGLAFMHVLPLREVRYIAFLAPLTACLLVPVLRWAAQRKVVMACAMIVLAIDVGRCSLEALQTFHPFYTRGSERRFLSVLDEPGARERPVFVNVPMLSFVSPVPSPLAADRYHRVFHFGVVHLRHVCGCRDLRIMANERAALQSASRSPSGSVLFYANRIVARGPSWFTSRSVAGAGFTQCAAVCQALRVAVATGNEDASKTSGDVVFLKTKDDTGPLAIQGPACAASELGELLPTLQINSTRRSYWLRRAGPDSYDVVGMQSAHGDELQQGAVLRRFEIERSTDSDSAN